MYISHVFSTWCLIFLEKRKQENLNSLSVSVYFTPLGHPDAELSLWSASHLFEIMELGLLFTISDVSKSSKEAELMKALARQTFRTKKNRLRGDQ